MSILAFRFFSPFQGILLVHLKKNFIFRTLKFSQYRNQSPDLQHKSNDWFLYEMTGLKWVKKEWSMIIELEIECFEWNLCRSKCLLTSVFYEQNSLNILTLVPELISYKIWIADYDTSVNTSLKAFWFKKMSYMDFSNVSNFLCILVSKWCNMTPYRRNYMITLSWYYGGRFTLQ